MKISVNKLATTPPNMEWSLCVFGVPSEEVIAWTIFHGLSMETSGKFTNIKIPEDFDLWDALEDIEPYRFMDGFSPNLNKHLHIGHLSNLVIAKAFRSLGLTYDTVSIFGDTLTGEVNRQDAEEALDKWLNWAGYQIDNPYYASQVEYHSPMVSGIGKYEGTKGFVVNGNYIVGIKSDGSTSYFYQDVALGMELGGATKLYLTGSEQGPHFQSLTGLFPSGEITHVPLGLVTAKSGGRKIASREGEKVMAQDIYDILIKEFPNPQLAYNVLAGFILNSSPKSSKVINLDLIKDVKQSPGLYLSYTLARLQSAGLKVNWGALYGNELSYATKKAQSQKNPKVLLAYLMKLAKKINNLYTSVRILDNPEGQELFQPMLNDLATGMIFLGFYPVKEV